MIIPVIHQSVETINPFRAEELLKKNKFNRKTTKARIDRYAGEMRQGKWKLNGQPLIFDEDGYLRNGQTRLRACIKSQCSFVTTVVRNVPRDAIPTVDIGQPWRSADYLSAEGNKYAHMLSSAIGWIMRILAGDGALGHNGWSPTPSQVLDFNRRHPEMEDSLRVGESCKLLLSKGITAALHYLFSKANKDAADQFFADLAKGSNLSDSDPVYALRQNLIKIRSQKIKLPTHEIAARVVRSWNQREQGLPALRALMGTKNGLFPDIYGLPEEDSSIL